MKKPTKKVDTILELKCPACGKVTKHYLSKTGKYKCVICGKANKSLKCEVEFECDETFINELN